MITTVLSSLFHLPFLSSFNKAILLLQLSLHKKSYEVYVYMKTASTGSKALHQLLKSFSTNSAFMNVHIFQPQAALSSHSHQSIYINRQVFSYSTSIIALDCSVLCFKLCYRYRKVTPRLSVATTPQITFY